MKHNVHGIAYKQWVTKPKATLEKKTVPTKDFVDDLCKAKRIFLHHSFIATQQASFYKNAKRNLKNDKCLNICDFSENYAFIIQNAITGFHWNNNQATIFSIVFLLQISIARIRRTHIKSNIRH